MRRSTLLVAALLGTTLAAQQVVPYQAHGRGKPRTDLAPLVQFVEGNPDIPTSREFELSWETGVRKMLTGDYQEAVNHLSQANYAAPTHPTAAFVYAIALLATERDALAAENFRGAIGLYPSWGELAIEPAEFFGSPLDYSRTEKRILKAYNVPVGTAPAPDVLTILGTLFYFQGEYQKAKIALDMLYQWSPSDRVANHFLRALQRREREAAGELDPGELDPGELELGPAPKGTTREALPEDPFDAGASLLFRGDYARALERFAEAVARDPTHPYAYYEMSQCLFALGRYEHAARTLREGLDRNDAILGSGLRRRDFYDDPLRLDAEIAALQETLRADTTNADLLLLLGFQLFLDDQRDRAVIATQLVDRLHPGDAHAAALLQAVMRRGADRAAPQEPPPPPAAEEDDRGGDVQDDVRRALPPLDADDGLSRFLAGDHHGAYLAFLQQLVSGSSPSPASPAEKTRRDVAFVLAALEADKPRHASTLCDKLLRSHAGGATLPIDLADFYDEPTDVARLQDAAQEFADREGDSTAQTLLGFILYYGGQRPRGRDVFTRILAINPGHAHAEAFVESGR